MSDKKKGFFSVIWESMRKTGGCCGPGESCGGSAGSEKEEAIREPQGETEGCCAPDDSCCGSASPEEEDVRKPTLQKANQQEETA